MASEQELILALQSRISSLESTITALRAPTTARAPPSTLAIALATAILAALGGYFYSQASSVGLFSSTSSAGSKPRRRRRPKKSWPNSYDVTVHPDSSDEELMRGLQRGRENGVASGSSSSSEEEEEEEETSGAEDSHAELSTFPSHAAEEHKLTLVLRTDLSMTRGKMVAQGSHATLGNYRYLATRSPGNPVLERWEAAGQAKVALRVDSEEEMLVLQAQAVSLGLCARVVRDAGRTQIAAGSVTALGVGPGPKSVIDKVTGGLKLL